MNKNKILEISSKAKYLNPALKRIADYIMANLERCKTITIKDLSLQCKVAESTITRFVKEVGFNSFQELKIGIAESLSQNTSPSAPDNFVYEDISPDDNLNSIIDKIFFKNIQRMTEARQLINVEALSQAVDAILAAKTLIFVSTGSSSVATNEAIMRFTRAGKRCIFWSDLSLQLMVAATSTSDDVLISISVSGRTKSVVQAAEIAKSNGATILGVTSDDQSPLATCSDILLFTPSKTTRSGSEALHWESTSSKNAQILVIDILYAAFAVKQHIQTIDNLNKTYNSLKSTRE